MEIGTFLGYSVGLGMLVSAITQIIKYTRFVPIIGDLSVVRFVLDAISRGNPVQIRTGVAVIATLLNIVSFFLNGGEVLDPMQFAMGVLAAFNSFMTALGTYNIVFEPFEKKR